MLLRRQILPLAAVAVVASLAALVALSCGGGGGSPSTSSPAPAPPAPAPSGGPVSQTCRIGVGSATAACAKQSSRLTDPVIAAMDQLLRQKPQLFDKSDANPPGSDNYRVLDKDAYLDGMIANLQAAACARSAIPTTTTTSSSR